MLPERELQHHLELQGDGAQRLEEGALPPGGGDHAGGGGAELGDAADAEVHGRCAVASVVRVQDVAGDGE